MKVTIEIDYGGGTIDVSRHGTTLGDTSPVDLLKSLVAGTQNDAIAALTHRAPEHA